MNFETTIYDKRVMADKIKDKLFSSMVRTRSKFNHQSYRKSSLNPNCDKKLEQNSISDSSAIRKQKPYLAENNKGHMKSKLEYELRILVGHAMVLDRLIEEIEHEDYMSQNNDAIMTKNDNDINNEELSVEEDNDDALTLVAEEERSRITDKIIDLDLEEEEDEDEVETINYEVNAFDEEDDDDDDDDDEEEHNYFTKEDMDTLTSRSNHHHNNLNNCKVYSMHNNSSSELNLILA